LHPPPLTDNYLVIGSDQVCHLDNQAYSKPGNNETAIRHLQAFSGRWVTFSTSLVLLNSSGERKDHVEDFRILFRRLTLAEIEYYVALDQPLDCAGAIKVEKAGVSLLSDTRGRDINSLYGLPLIALCDGFAELGYSIKDFN
jgi:MAF protein